MLGEWVQAADETKLKEDWINVAFPKGISVVLVKREGKLFAVRNRCYHMSCTMGGGKLDGYILQCPCHDWRYDIRTGEFLDAKELRIDTYETKVEGGKVYVRL